MKHLHWLLFVFRAGIIYADILEDLSWHQRLFMQSSRRSLQVDPALSPSLAVKKNSIAIDTFKHSEEDQHL